MKTVVRAAAANDFKVRSADLDLLPQYQFGVLVRRMAVMSPL